MKKFLITLKGDRLRSNIYIALLQYLAIAMVLFTICRLGFYIFNYSYFKELDRAAFLYILLGGIKFDLTAVLYVNALFILMMILPFRFRFNSYYLITVKWIFFVTNAIALAANVCDFIYFKFTLRRTTAEVFQQFENETNMTGLIFRFLIDYWYALFFWIGMVALLIWIYRKIKVSGPMFGNPWAFYVGSVLAIPLVVLFFIGGVRGGFRHSTRPITLNDANKYVKDPKDVSLVLNTPFSILRTMNKTKIQRVKYFTDDEVKNIYNPVHVPVDTSSFEKKNVVVIILESFSKEFFGVFNKDKENGNYKGYTPFLDSLVQHSITYDYSFANGRKSIDGLPSVMASIPSMGVPYVLSPYSGNRISSLATLLRSKGYHTSFFHGAPNGSMGFDAFTNIAGFDHYYGKTEYNNDDDFDGWWGIWDEKFFNFYADKLNEFPRPFASAIFSVSSHHPFQVPAEYENTFKGGSEPILKCIEYTDFALQKFFTKASKMPWFKNTLFVITADHTSSNVLFDESRTASGFFSIPIIFYDPSNDHPERRAEIAQQIDIMPSVLGYLHYDEPYLAYGRDTFHQVDEPFAFNYKGNVYQLIQGDFLLEYDGVKSLGLYNFKTDKMSTSNLLDKMPEVVSKMEMKVKAVIQQYNNRLIDNQMTIAK
jgi:phosphoglycerol transferase MdoB-like AlkP superfamily enzyme